MNTEARLDQIRGKAPPRNRDARTIAALTSNPGRARRAVMAAAGVGKQRVASHAGFPAPFGQPQFAITRGNAFEAQVIANGCAELLRLLREQLRLPIPERSYDDLEEAGGNTSRELRHARTRSSLARAAASGADGGTLFDHPLLRLEAAGQQVYLRIDDAGLRRKLRRGSGGRMPGASTRLTPGGSGAATEAADRCNRHVADTGGVPAAMEPLPNNQASDSLLGRGSQSQPAKCAAKITRMRNVVILNHWRHVAVPIQAMSDGQVRGSIRSGFVRRRGEREGCMFPAFQSAFYTGGVP